MQKFRLTVMLLILLIMFHSCRKDVQENGVITKISIDTTITAGSDYELSLIPYGDDDDIATIIQQATNFSISQLEDLSDVFNPVYHYVPAKINGTDKVVLAINKHPDITQSNRDSTIITIHFTIK